MMAAARRRLSVDKVIFEQRPPGKPGSVQSGHLGDNTDTWGRASRAQGIVSAKALGQEYSCQILETVRRSL